MGSTGRVGSIGGALDLLGAGALTLWPGYDSIGILLLVAGTSLLLATAVEWMDYKSWIRLPRFWKRRHLVNDYMNLHELLHHLGVDVHKYNKPPFPPLINRIHQEIELLRQLARDGTIKLRGQPGFKYPASQFSIKPIEAINASYWANAGIFPHHLFHSNPDEISTMPDEAMGKGQSDSPTYKKLRLERAGVYRHFKKGLLSDRSAHRNGSK